MNATQDASNDMQNDINKKLISFNDTQNELIFSTRKRLFDLEKIQRRDVFFLLGMNFLICTLCILIAVKFGGFTW
jgi:hypothetical protein|tara:strand:- start:182 stop:406 length:225 start_codon:yes stop_codon:yes gene_type:complete